MSSITRTRLDGCATKDCPWRDDWDFHQIPWCQGLEGEHFKVVTHQHFPKKGMGGNNPKSRIVALLCWDCHDRIDNRDWGNAVKEINGKRVYMIWDHLHGEILYERDIGASSDGEDGRVAPREPVRRQRNPEQRARIPAVARRFDG